MKRTFTLLLLLAITPLAKAQSAIPAEQPYGKIDKADLEMTSCDFEKDANAEVLIDKGELYYDQRWDVVVNYHKRVKIFNDNGKGEANIKLGYYSIHQLEYITGLQAETINMVDGKPEVTKLDKKQIYTQPIDKYRSAMVFAMPNVKAGSIIDIQYSWNTTNITDMPVWYFQGNIPVRYSELFTHIPEYFLFTVQAKTLLPFAVNTSTQENGSFGTGTNMINYTVNGDRKAMVNVPSLPKEPYMSSYRDNLASLHFLLTTFKPPYGFIENFSDTWKKVGDNLAENEDFGGQLKRKLNNEEEIIKTAKSLKTDDEKIAYIFNTVKNDMKWDGNDDWYTQDGTSEAWTKKTGNSTEINLILYHLLKKSGVAAMPMIVSTREHGRVNPVFTFLYQFNRAVVYIPVDSTKQYILDASGKYNTYNEIPSDILNSSGLYLNMDNKTYDLFFIAKNDPVRTSVFINAEIKPDGKVAGTAQISSGSYDRIAGINRYKTDGEKKYIDYLTDDDNNLKISSLKLENMEIDTLPLMQSMDFQLDLPGTDENYIYLNPNILTLLHKNPFLSEDRKSDIDFGYMDNLTLNSIYKMPAGYKVDALPKSVSMTTPDNSITFKRIVVEQNGDIMVRYNIYYKKTIFFKEDYADFHAFYKKMYELLNEQIVLKKS